MFCTQCGNELNATSVFCDRCGTIVGNNSTIDKIDTVTEVSHERKITNKKMWLFPIVTAIFMVVLLGISYGYELKVNHDIEAFREQGEKMALDGKIDDGKKLVEKALAKRPNYKTLQSDLEMMNTGEAIDNQLLQAKELTKQQKFQESIGIVEKAEKQAKDGHGAFYKMLQKQVSDQKTVITVAEVKYEMKDKKTVEELAPLLTKLSAFHVSEAQEAMNEVKNQMAEIAYSLSNELIEKKQFSDALKIIDQALQYDPKNDKLLSFKDTIKKQQAEFEQAEQQKIEQAMVAAAQEDQKNKTQAVKVLQVNGIVNDSGDFVVSGQVKNIATRPIRMVKIYYSVYDVNGKVLGSSYTYVYPNYLAPGDTGSFDQTHYGVWQGKRVEITNTTWYLD